MLPKLQIEFDSLNNSLANTLNYMDNLSVESRYASKPGEWNAAQILYHLKDAESGTLAYLSKKIQAPKSEVPRGGLSSKIRSVMLSRALRNYDRKFKVPSGLNAVPEQPDYDKVRKEYLDVRKKMGLLLERFDKKMVNKAYFKHPRAGRITILQTMGFLKDHFDRHTEQIIERSC